MEYYFNIIINAMLLLTFCIFFLLLIYECHVVYKMYRNLSPLVQKKKHARMRDDS